MCSKHLFCTLLPHCITFLLVLHTFAPLGPPKCRIILGVGQTILCAVSIYFAHYCPIVKIFYYFCTPLPHCGHLSVGLFLGVGQTIRYAASIIFGLHTELQIIHWTKFKTFQFLYQHRILVIILHYVKKGPKLLEAFRGTLRKQGVDGNLPSTFI